MKQVQNHGVKPEKMQAQGTQANTYGVRLCFSSAQLLERAKRSYKKVNVDVCIGEPVATERMESSG